MARMLWQAVGEDQADDEDSAKLYATA